MLTFMVLSAIILVCAYILGWPFNQVGQNPTQMIAVCLISVNSISALLLYLAWVPRWFTIIDFIASLLFIITLVLDQALQ